MEDLIVGFRTRDELVAYLNAGVLGTRRVLASTLVGDTLWRIVCDKTRSTLDTSAVLLCDALVCEEGMWRERSLSGRELPHTCPLSFLEIAGFDDRLWRHRVRVYHEAMQRDLRPGDAVFLYGFKVPYLTLTHRYDIAFKSIFEGDYEGETYVLTPAHLRLATDYLVADVNVSSF